MKKTIYTLFIALPTLAFINIVSNGAPASSSGAPGEVNCTTSGCHSDLPLNSGLGNVNVTVSNGAIEYVPGSTYTITVNVSQNNITRFGFQVSALTDNDSTTVGTFKVIDSVRTQLIDGFGNFFTRKYMTYKYPGTAAVTLGIGQWTFEWTAPLTNKGAVTFYVAGIAANNDGTDLGDYCYLKSLKLNAAPVGIEKYNLENKINLKVFPNPARNKLTFSCVLEKATEVKVLLSDINGNLLEEWNSEAKEHGIYTKTLSLNKDYPKGIYFLQIIESNKKVQQKVIID